MYSYDTLSEALTDLRKRGFQYDFNLNGDCLECSAQDAILQHDEFDVREQYRFEGATNPSDESVLYAIESTSGIKGVFVKAFGTYGDAIPEPLRSKLHFAR